LLWSMSGAVLNFLFSALAYVVATKFTITHTRIYRAVLC
jgi:hypothetical protein